MNPNTPRPTTTPPTATELPQPGVIRPRPGPFPVPGSSTQRPTLPLPGSIQGPGERW